MSIWRGRAGNPQVSDIGDLLHPQNSNKAPQAQPKGWGSLTNGKYMSKMIFAQGLPRGFGQGSSALGEDL